MLLLIYLELVLLLTGPNSYIIWLMVAQIGLLNLGFSIFVLGLVQSARGQRLLDPRMPYLGHIIWLGAPCY